MKKEEKRRRSKEEKGITLIALVITIIILLILAGVTLNAALSENGLFKKAKYAAEEYNQKAIEEEIQLMLAEQEIDAANSNGKADITDVLEKVKESEGAITEDDIQEFNEKYLKDYDEKIIPIHNETEFKQIGQEEYSEYPLNGIYVQVNDFTSLEITQPIGTRKVNENGTVESENPFAGVYNGNGKKIINLTITDTNGCVGMFGYNEGTIRDVTIENCEVTSDNSYVGAIVGTNTGLIKNCVINQGNVLSSIGDSDYCGYVGGICGRSENSGMIRNCKSKCNVNGYWGVGGICGENLGNVEYCVNEGSIKGDRSAGGICGSSFSGLNHHIFECLNIRRSWLQRSREKRFLLWWYLWTN